MKKIILNIFCFCFSISNLMAQGDSIIVYGCNDPHAINYNPDCNKNDGSCICDSNSNIVYGATNFLPSDGFINGTGYATKIFNALTNDALQSIQFIFDTISDLKIQNFGCQNKCLKFEQSFTDDNALYYIDDLEAKRNFIIIENDTTEFSIEYPKVTYYFYGGSDTTIECVGCKDPKAINYNLNAIIQDNSCICDTSSRNIKLTVPSDPVDLTPFVNLSILKTDSSVILPIDTSQIPLPASYQTRLVFDYGCQNECLKVVKTFNDDYLDEIFRMTPFTVRYSSRLVKNDTDTIFATIQTPIFEIPFFSGTNENFSCFGCTDSTSLNFKETAIYDDGSCICENGNAVLILENDYKSFPIYNYYTNVFEGIAYGYNNNNFSILRNDSSSIQKKNDYILVHSKIIDYGCLEDCAIFQLKYPNHDVTDSLEWQSINNYPIGDFSNRVYLRVNNQIPISTNWYDIAVDPDGILSYIIENNDSSDSENCNFIIGCLDSNAVNNDTIVSFIDNSFCYYYPGCDLVFAENFDPLVDHNDGSCEVIGCLDSLAINNYDYITQNDGICTYGLGCLDSTADNYNAFALGDNNLCFYYSDSIANVLIGVRAFGNSMFGWNLINNEDSVIYFDVTPLTYTNQNNLQIYKISLPLGCYTLNFTDYNRYDVQYANYYFNVKVGEDYIYPGEYHSSYYNSDYFLSKSFCVNTLETAINEFNQIVNMPRVVVYPNPSTGELLISNIYKDELLKVEIVDITGNLVYQNNRVENNTILKLDYLSNGLYSVKLQNKSNHTKLFKWAISK
jgi:Secretion system C-terminal sorting domain